MDEHNRYVVTDPNSPATRKQIAFLTYLKQSIPRKLTKGQAAELIDSAKKTTAANDRGCWLSTRRLLYPDLYYEEDISELYEILYSYIRDKMRAGSKKLTQKKIISVIDVLDKTQRGWSASLNFRQLFLAKLKEIHAGCCDMKGQERDPVIPESSALLSSLPAANSRTKNIYLHQDSKQSPKQPAQSVSYTWLWILLILVLLAGLFIWAKL